MPTNVEETLAAAFSLYEIAYNAGESVPDSSALQEKFVQAAKARTIFEPTLMMSDPGNPPFLSPVMEAILDIYRNPLARRSYVLHADASTGKSAAASHIMKSILPALKHAPHGVMIGGLAPNDDYFTHMASLLGASGAKGWARALIQALVPDPKSPQRRHSILILDEFNSAGPDDINISFARTLYKALTDKSIYLLIMTQDKSVAEKLADLSNRSKITALPGAVTNPEAPMGKYFDWKPMVWNLALLTKYLERMDEGKNPEIFSDKNDRGELNWLDGPMTPHNARWKYEEKIGAPFDQEDENVILAHLFYE
jgi:hypothetical protein